MSKEVFHIVDECIILLDSVTDSDVIKPRNISSFKSLLEGALIRNYHPLLDFSTNFTDTAPDISYHKRCRVLFMRVGELNKLENTVQDQDSQNESAGETEIYVDRATTRSKRSHLEKGTSSRLFKVVCIFCNKDKWETKYNSRSRSREMQTKVMTLEADDRIRKAAALHNDSTIMALACRDLVAAEAHYHKSCYKNFIKILYKTDATTNKNTDSSDDCNDQ